LVAELDSIRTDDEREGVFILILAWCSGVFTEGLLRYMAKY
jgi:hypothetical protein